MQGNKKSIKTICPENKIDAVIPIPAKVVAEVSGFSESTVKKVDAGTRSSDTEAGKKIVMARQLLSEGSTVLVDAVRNVMKKL
jgi:hypothetical protein